MLLLCNLLMDKYNTAVVKFVKPWSQTQSPRTFKVLSQPIVTKFKDQLVLKGLVLTQITWTYIYWTESYL